MKPTGAHRILVERGELLSWLMLPGMSEEQAAPAVVRFSAGDGVTVLLLDAPKGWPTELGHRGELIIHGVTVDGGQPFTVMGARVNRLAMFDQARSMHATTLGLGARFDRTTTWSSASFGTAHLHEWAGETGLRVTDREHSEDGQLQRLVQEWTPPPAHVIESEEARLTVGPVMQTTFTHGPEQRVVTSTRLGVRPAQPMTLDELERSYARPLLAFCTFAADRPDAIVHEAVSDKERREQAIILRSGRTVEPREWRPDNRFLFRAEQIDDVSRLYGRWMKLWDEASVEIATFVDAISEGNTYNRARLLAGVAALEAYWRTRLQFDEDGNKRKGSSLVDKLKMLRAYTAIDPNLIGATNANLRLLAAARNLYAHLDQTIVNLTDEQVDDHLLDNCRRAAALLQGCLLRDLNIEPPKAQAMFEEHLSNWPLS